ncbi:Lrp/AsnC family transcriptional regulator [Natrinema versiforme]|uniref:Transcriptional regulatory protein, AsnC family n=1 Tax=Natrinema versiforme JCM 10478 TaxID=1227496 RepID=L9XUN9_9EURY|nr:Lrp/AsnC family transcriptional regulator [Natrinema versiforme]ELY65509.1 transcriptional regulatory protein, AsnC family [Natrinema versiforme JCM 10478]
MNHTTAMPDLDEPDLEHLSELERSTEKNLGALAAEFDLSKSTGHYRLTQLRERGVISAISADVDPRSLGMTMVVITGVSDDTGPDRCD